MTPATDGPMIAPMENVRPFKALAWVSRSLETIWE